MAARARRPATPELAKPDRPPSRSGFWQAIGSFFRTVFRLLRWTWSSAWKLTAVAAVILVGIVLLREDLLEPVKQTPATPPQASLPPSSPASPGTARSVEPRAQWRLPAPAVPRTVEGKIFPLGAKAWAAPAVNPNDPSVGLFPNGARVEILDRVTGPYGWDWLKVRGLTTAGQQVEAYVRSDLVAGTNIKPQPGTRCAKDNLLEKFGRTPVYDQAVIEAMSGLEDTFPGLELTRLPPGTIFSVVSSLRGSNGWEWHKVALQGGRTGVIRADQLRVAPATFENGSWNCDGRS